VIVELYRLSIGNEAWRYTTAQQALTHNGEEYEPVYCKRDALKSTGEVARSGVKIYLPRDADFVTRFAPTPPTDEAEVEIYQRDDSGTALVWLGRALTVSRKGSQAEIACDSIFSSMKTAGLRRPYQKPCPHALYDHNCRVTRANFRVDATLTAVGSSALTLTATAFAGQPDGWFTGGDIEWGALPERRLIVGHSGDTITLATPLGDAVAGDAVVAFAGCDHTFATCRDKFANKANYGGMPFIPTQNPFGSDPVF